VQIQEDVSFRASEIASRHSGWPCRKGCDECCRRLAAAPRVTADEWRSIAAALDALRADVAEAARRRIAESASVSGPLVCPLLDTVSGTCLVYEARPVACRAYGFYAERAFVLGCARIESMSEALPDVIWGNHNALQERLHRLGPASDFAEWLGVN
jgi:uncharacterized protein